MRIVFTKHARKKFADLAKIGVKVLRKDVITTIKDAEHIDIESEAPKIISSRPTDKRHILRVVFKIENDIITVITFYPARKGRYYEPKEN